MQTTGLKGYPLSKPQARLWALQGESQAYHAQCTVWLKGELDLSAFLSACQCLVKRHEILRTRFQRFPGMEIPLQVVTSTAEIDSPVIDLQDLSTEDQTVYLHKELTRLQRNTANREAASPLSLVLLRLSSARHLLLMHLPALCADGYTLMQMVAELVHIYDCISTGVDQDEEPLQYADVAAWQEQLLASEEAETLGQHFREIDWSQLATCRLPFEPKASAAISLGDEGQKGAFAPRVFEVSLPERFASQIRHLAQQYCVSLDAWFLACWEVTLWRLMGKQDFLIGVACDGREYEELTEELAKGLGLYTRLVPVSVLIGDDLPFDQMVPSVNTSLREILKRQYYFTWELPFFSICFESERWPASFVARKLSLSLYQRFCCIEPFALKLNLLQVGESLQLEIQYDSQRISTTQIHRLATVFLVLLEETLVQPQAPICTLPLLSSEEQVSLLKLGHAPTRPILAQGLHQLFEEQAALRPNHLAVICSGGRQEQLTYRQLNEQANQLAQALRQRGVGTNRLAPTATPIVALCLARTTRMLVGLLGILKAGGAYLPLDPDSPSTRLAYQLQESQAVLLLTEPGLVEQLPAWDERTLYLEELEQQQVCAENLPSPSEPEDLAYVIYTSGSTGAPKGVMIRHSSVVNYTRAMCDLLGAQTGWHYATVSTLSADLGNTAIFCALASGGCVQVLDPETITSTEKMARWVQQHPIDVLKIVPSHLSALLTGEMAQELLPRQALVLGGEACPANLMERLQELRGTFQLEYQVFNHYGPTETTIGVLVHRLTSLATPPLGKPIANTEISILDDQMYPVPPGVTGEIYIGGTGLALGYLGQPDQTAEHFVPHPYTGNTNPPSSRRDSGLPLSAPGARLYRTGDLAGDNNPSPSRRDSGLPLSAPGARLYRTGDLAGDNNPSPSRRDSGLPLSAPGARLYRTGDLARDNNPSPSRRDSGLPLSAPGARLYRTGDLARYNANGEIEFIGRRDRQIKLRGYRIELAEIETVLRQCQEVWDCTVQLQEEGPGVPQIIGYVVARTASGLTPASLREILRKVVPAYMVPAHFVMLEALPLTPNGKVDRQRLPKPEQAIDSEPLAQREPRSPLEDVLVGIWQELLGVRSPGVHDNFFAMGGHSLLVTRMIARVRAVLQVDLSVQAVFHAPTVAELAQLVEQALRNGEATQTPPLVPVERPDAIPLSFAQQRLWFLEQLEPGSTAYLIPRVHHFSGMLNIKALEKSFTQLAQRHEILRTTFEVRAGNPVQVIHPMEAELGRRDGQGQAAVPTRFSLPVIDLRALRQEQRAHEAQQLAQQEAQCPIDLSRGPLLRTSLLRLDVEEHILLLTMHHIITDAWSNGIFVGELTALYQANVSEHPFPLAPLLIQYADYAIWQRQWLQSNILLQYPLTDRRNEENSTPLPKPPDPGDSNGTMPSTSSSHRAGPDGFALERQLTYWREQLANTLPLALPTDHPRPATQTYQGATQALQLPTVLSERLVQLCQQTHVTLFMLLLAAWQILLARYSGGSDIAIGTPIANRNRAETEGLIGFFVNTLVLRTDLRGNPPFLEALQRVREVCLGAYANPDIPFEKVVDALQPERDLSRSPLFQVMFALQNAPDRVGTGLAPVRVGSMALTHTTSKFDLTLSIDQKEQELRCILEYSTDLFEAPTITRMLTHFQALLEGIVQNPQAHMSDLPLLTQAEREQMLVEWNATKTGGVNPPLQDRCVHQLFEQQVQRTPDAVALVFEDQTLTYAELNRRANQLAHHLRKRGLGPEGLVSICMQRSLEMVIALLSVLKAGSAYLPLEPSDPETRLIRMLEEVQPLVVLTQTALLSTLVLARTPLIALDMHWPVLRNEESFNPVSEASGEHLAYIIYTSGSTGTPKGILITHQGLTNYLNFSSQYYEALTGRGSIVHSSLAFDLTVTALFAPLMVGDTVVLVGEEDGREGLSQTLRQWGDLSFVKMTPAHLEMLTVSLHPDELAKGARSLIIGGEALSATSLVPWHTHAPKTRLINEYGPTETVVGCCIYEVPTEGMVSGNIPIGRPIANTELYVLDVYLQPVPVGVVGELYIGGVGLARGYFKRPELTAEKFIPNPFLGTGQAQGTAPAATPQEPTAPVQSGMRLYRTGDLARYRADGTLEFVGRVDHQVKLRGYRIELGEIETVLREHEAIQECVVLIREDVPGEKRLVASPVMHQGQTITPNDLRSYLQDRLPAYMIPQAFVFLDALPLTPNGKVDRRALPAPEGLRPPLSETFVGPRTSIERTLATIWSEVLRIKQVGIHDNFFALGGDSILSIQVVSRARQVGLHLTPKQIFQYQSIAQLSHVVTKAQTLSATQALVTGPVPLTPIQHWFFARHLPESHHFNQSVLLETTQELRPAWLERALVNLVLHHDALRLCFRQQPDGWQQDIAGPPSYPFWLTIDLSALSEEQQTSVMESLAEVAQASLLLSAGLLLRALFFLRGESRPDRLLLIIHHLAVDGVSWRILLEDLSTLCEQQSRRDAVHLPDKTTSWQQWARLLQKSAQSDVLRADLGYWLAPERKHVMPLPVDLSLSTNTVPRSATVQVSLNVEQTQALLQEVPLAYQTQINDVLLTALVEAFASWTGQDHLLVDLEGHGREALTNEEVDLSRTVGWFTTLFPVLLTLQPTMSPGKALKAIKEQLRQIPQKGFGYGLLRHLRPDPDIAEALANVPQAEVVFNYLGQFDSSFQRQALFRLADGKAGPTHSRLEQRSHLLEINGSIVGGTLHVAFQYNQDIHHRATIQRLAHCFIEALEQLIAHCRLPHVGGYTPSDFPLAELNQLQLDSITQQIQKERQGYPRKPIEEIYPLSPMQAGLLFQSLYARDAGVYCVQFGWTIRGRLHVEAWKRAWQEMVNRHAILRTLLVWQGLSQPLQVVCKQVELPYELHDWRSLEAGEQQHRLATLCVTKELTSVDLGRAPLLRLTLACLGEQTYYFHFSLHHLIIDGWSQSLLLAEVQAYYHAFCQGQEPELAPVRPYRDYIAWLKLQDTQQAEQFWRAYLAGFTTPNRLPGRSEASHTESSHLATQQLQLSATETSSLQELARQQQLTLNTLFQGAWALLLYRYSGEEDVLFGATTTGRPGELTGVETMIGVFINTLPVRVRVAPDTSLSGWLHQLQAEQVQARQYEYTPLVQIQTWSQIKPGQSLFESLMLFQNYPVAASILEQSSESLIQRVLTREQTHYPLMVKIVPTKAALTISLQYDETRFEAAMIARMLQHFQTLLQVMVASPEQRLQDLLFLSAEERQQLLVEWNTTKTNYPQEMTVHQLFEQQVQRTPEAVALVFEDETLTYDTLNRRADQLAHYLQREVACGRGQASAGSEVLIGISMERSLEMVIGLLGILKAGGAYVPLDPTYPQERLTFMMADSQIALVLTHHLREGHQFGTSGVGKTVYLDTDWDEIASDRESNLQRSVTAENLVYVMYTSGSTGRPKGTMVTHRNVVNFFTAMDQRIGDPEPGIWLAVTSISFDISVLELFWTLTRGFRVVVHANPHDLGLPGDRKGREGASPSSTHLASQCGDDGFTPSRPLRSPGSEAASPSSTHLTGQCGDDGFTPSRPLRSPGPPETIAAQIPRQSITHLQCTPSQVKMLMRDAEGLRALNCLQKVLLGGEALPISLAQQLGEIVVGDIHNMYGPTETTIWSSTYPVAKHSTAMAIGRPIANTQIYILDKHMQVLPIGVPGELYIGGKGVTRGYWNHPDLTAEKFLPDPFVGTGLAPVRGALIYRTGDLARYRHDGAIEYLGRTDSQIKIRGYRIELSEIEAILGGHPGIQECVVLAREDALGEKSLVAYPVVRSGQTITTADLRSYLQDHLPAYMIPQAFVELSTLPLTPNGKVDRHALPSLDNARPELAVAFVSPRTPAEQVMADIWSEVLGIEQVGIYDNFFELGGHSLRAVQIISQVCEVFQVEVPLISLFERPTIEGLVNEMAQLLGGREIVEEVALAFKEIEQLSEEDVQNILYSQGQAQGTAVRRVRNEERWQR